MRNLYFFFLFIFFNSCIFFFDFIIFIPYIIFFYLYLLSPFYYFLILLFSYMRVLFPIFCLYFIMCYNYKSYKELKFFGFSLNTLKKKIFFFKSIYFFKEKFYYIYFFCFLGFFIYLVLNELFIFIFIIFSFFIIYIYIYLIKIFIYYSWWKINFFLNIFIIFLINLYINLLSLWYSIFELNLDIETMLWEVHWFKLCYKYISWNWLDLGNVYDSDGNKYLVNFELILEGISPKYLKYEEYVNFLYKKFIYSHFSWIYLSFIKASNEYLDQLYYKIDNENININYDQWNLHINWDRVNIILKNINNHNSQFTYINKENELINCFTNTNTYNLIIQQHLIKHSKIKYNSDIKYYMELIWDELKDSSIYIPTGIDYPIVYSLQELAKRDAVDLKLLLTDYNLNNNFINFKYLLDNLFWYKYKNIANKYWDIYLNLYYILDQNPIQINLEYFFLNYLKKNNLYNNKMFLIYNEVLIMDYLVNYYKEKFEINFLILPIESSIRELSNHIFDDYIKESSILWDWSITTTSLKSNNILKANFTDQLNYLSAELQIFEDQTPETWEIFLEKFRRFQFADEGVNLEFALYSRKYLTPTNLLLQQYWVEKFNKYNIDYDTFYINNKDNNLL